MTACLGRKPQEQEITALAKELAEARSYRSNLAREVFGSVATDFGRVWRAFVADPRGPVEGILERHRSMMMSVAFSPNGAFLASGASDGKVRLWKVSSVSGSQGQRTAQ